MKVALVYDRVTKFGGAERALLALHKIWPDAPLYTALYDPKGAPWAEVFQVIPSWINQIPLLNKRHELIPWLMPFAFESFNFDQYEVVISVTSAEAKGIITKPRTLHICYCLTPTRYLWSSAKLYHNKLEFGWWTPIVKILVQKIARVLKKWDLVASQRPDCYLAISKTVQQRIKKYYHRQANVIYPPIDTKKFKVKSLKLKVHPSAGGLELKINKQYFLAVARLVTYKRVDLIIEAFNHLGLPLIIIGDGLEREKLEKMAKPNIKFLGQKLTDSQLLSYYQNCLALVFAGEEDFGLVALEAQACGKPVIAYKIGGIGETVISGKTGILYTKQSIGDLKRAVLSFQAKQFKPQECRENSLKYSQVLFINKFKQIMEEKWQAYQQQR